MPAIYKIPVPGQTFTCLKEEGLAVPRGHIAKFYVCVCVCVCVEEGGRGGRVAAPPCALRLFFLSVFCIKRKTFFS